MVEDGISYKDAKRCATLAYKIAMLPIREEKWITQHTQYGYAFYDFDGTTGFLIWDRLTEKDKQMISTLANMIVGGK